MKIYKIPENKQRKFELTKGEKGDIIIKSPDEDDENSTLKTEQCKKKVTTLEIPFPERKRRKEKVKRD